MKYPPFARALLSVGMAVWLATAAVPAIAGIIVIDEFDKPDSPKDVFFIRGPSGTDDEYLVQHADSSIIGGERDVLVEVLGTAGPLSAAGMIGYESDYYDAGIFQLATYGEPGTKATLQYDGSDPSDIGDGVLDDVGLLPSATADLTDSGANDRFVLRFVSSDGVDPQGLDMKIIAEGKDASNNSITLTYWGYVADNDQPFTHTVLFSDFTQSGVATFGNVNSLMFLFNLDGTANIDFALDAIKAVPEPSAWALLGCGIALAFCRYRRVRR